MTVLSCASFFSGVGGIEKGFEKAGFNTIYANEFDANAIKTYTKNNSIDVDQRDICEVAPHDIPKEVDVYLAGFPCQAFSVAGYREGFKDKQGRGNLFFELARIFKKNKPEIIFLENVKHLLGHDKGKTFRIIYETIANEGYNIKYQVLNTMDYGNIPQNRERIYIVAFKDQEICKNFVFPKPVKLKTELNDFIDYKNKVPAQFYYTETFKHYNELEKHITRKDTVYQWRRVYVRENKSGVCPTLTANMGTGGHNVPLILTDDGIRKLTPRECFNLQGFSKKFILPDDVALSQLYKQAGNSVSIPVIERIAKHIRSAITATENNHSSNLLIKSS